VGADPVEHVAEVRLRVNPQGLVGFGQEVRNSFGQVGTT
jgi:hypothetical protein